MCPDLLQHTLEQARQDIGLQLASQQFTIWIHVDVALVAAAGGRAFSVLESGGC